MACLAEFAEPSLRRWTRKSSWFPSQPRKWTVGKSGPRKGLRPLEGSCSTCTPQHFSGEGSPTKIDPSNLSTGAPRRSQLRHFQSTDVFLWHSNQRVVRRRISQHQAGKQPKRLPVLAGEIGWTSGACKKSPAGQLARGKMKFWFVLFGFVVVDAEP